MVLDSQDTRLLHKLLRQGMSAVAILPEREVAAGTLESFPMRRLDVPGLDLAPVLIWLEHAYLSRTARRVIQCLHKVNAIPANNRILRYEKGLSSRKTAARAAFLRQTAVHFVCVSPQR